MNVNKKVLIPVVVTGAVLLLGAGAASWYLSTPSGKDMALERQFNNVAESNRDDNFRQALVTVLPKNRPAEFEYFYENRDDQADYTEAVLIGPNESYVKISSNGEVKTTPITVSEDTRNALFDALLTIPVDQIRVQSLPLKIPVPGEVVVGGTEAPQTKVETLRVTFGQNQAERQNLVYISGPSTEITDQSRDNWNLAKGLGEKVLEKFRPKK